MANIASSGILSFSQNDTWLRNYVGNSCRAYADVSAYYTFGDSSYNNEIANNVANDIIGSSYDTSPHIPVCFIYTDEYAYNTSIHNNIGYYISNGTEYGMFNNNTTNTPPNTYVDNIIYDDNLASFEENNGTSSNAIFSGNTNPAESTYQKWDLTVITLGGDWFITVNGTTSQYASETTQSIPEGAYVITYEDDIDTEVYALIADAELNRGPTPSFSAKAISIGSPGVSINSGLSVGSGSVRVN